MSTVYSRKTLAKMISDGHDTSSAATALNKSIDFVQKEQKSNEYSLWLKHYLSKRPSVSTGTAARNYSTELQAGRTPDPP